MSRTVPEPNVSPSPSQIGDPTTQAEKFVVSVFEDTVLWDSIDETKVPTKQQFGPRGIYYGGWFNTCNSWSFVCVNDLSSLQRGAMCVSDCAHVDGKGVAGRYSAADVEAYIKKPAYYRTAKDYHPNIDQTIEMATNIEAAYLNKTEAENLPIYAY